MIFFAGCGFNAAIDVHGLREKRTMDSGFRRNDDYLRIRQYGVPGSQASLSSR